jgi:hypothetical protein
MSRSAFTVRSNYGNMTEYVNYALAHCREAGSDAAFMLFPQFSW